MWVFFRFGFWVRQQSVVLSTLSLCGSCEPFTPNQGEGGQRKRERRRREREWRERIEGGREGGRWQKSLKEGSRDCVTESEGRSKAAGEGALNREREREPERERERGRREKR